MLEKHANSPERKIFFGSFNLDEAWKDWSEKHQDFMTARKSWDEDKKATFSRQAQSLLETLTAKLDEAKEYLGGAKNLKRYNSTRLAQTLIEQIKADLAQLGLTPTTENSSKLISETQQRFVSLLAQVEKKLAELKLTSPDNAAVRTEEMKKLYARLVNEEDITLPVLKENLTAADFEKIAEKFQNLKNDLDGLLNKTSEKISTADELKTELKTALPTTEIKLDDDAATAPAPTNIPLADSAEIATTTLAHQKILDQLSKIKKVPYQSFKDNSDKITKVAAAEPVSIPNSEKNTITTELVPKFNFDKEKSSQIIERSLKKIIDNNITIETTEVSSAIKESLTKSSEILTEKSTLSKLQSEKQTTKFHDLIEKITTDAKTSKEVASKSSKGLRHIAASFALIGLLLLAGKNFIPEEFKKEPVKPEKKKGATEQFESGGQVQATQPDWPEYIPPAEEIPAISLVEAPPPVIQPAAEPLLQPDTVAFNPNDYPYNPKAREIPVAGSSESEEFEEAMKKQASPPAPELKQPTSQPITNEGANLLPKK